MKVASSTLQWQAQHSAVQSQTHSAKLRVWVGERNAQRPAATSQRLSNAGSGDSATQASHRTSERDSDSAHLTPTLRIMRDLIERMTGVRATVSPLSTQDLSNSANSATNDVTVHISTQARAQSAAAQNVGWGVEYDEHNVYEEAQSSQWAAQGVIRTADGQEIAFSVALQMQRYYRQESSSQLRLGDAKKVDPLVINFDGDAAQLQEMRFSFDLNADGDAEELPLLAGNRGFLALDRNTNGRIDDGRELFGPLSGDGYADLAQYDDDRNGWIDENDSTYAALRVWTPTADGAGQMRSLQEAGVGALSLDAAATPFELRTADNRSLGTVRATSAYLREDGSGAGTMQQVDLTV